MLNCASFGTPQNRRRLIVVCGHRPFTPPAATHGPGTSSPYVTCRDALGVTVIGGGRNPQSREVSHKRSYRDITDEPSVTITAVMVGNRGPFTMGKHGRKVPMSQHQCSIIQGFPQDYPWGGQIRMWPGSPITGSSSGSLYRQIGNAVPPQLSEAIGLSVIASDASVL